MSDQNQERQDQILLNTLADVPFDGWTWQVVEQAAEKAGIRPDIAVTLFPERIQSVLIHFSDWADRQMLGRLKEINGGDMRVRDRVRCGVVERLDVLLPHKEALRLSSSYWLNPFRKVTAVKMVWKTADKIWIWAGDTATDYNHYTKRGLLSGVITATTMAWLNDTSDNHEETLAFLDRRIDNVLTVGKFASRFKGRVDGLKSTVSKG